MTVLRIVLTPLLLEKPQPREGNSAVPVAFAAWRRSVSEAEGPPSMPRNLLQRPGSTPWQTIYRIKDILRARRPL